MSLSERVKDILHSSDSDPDRIRPPGSFPTDDMAPNSENMSSADTHQRSKLHKPNDPRGKGHTYSDSGVAMEPSDQEALTREPVEEAYAPAEGYEERREHAKRSGVAEFDDVHANQRDTTEYNGDPKDLGTTVGTTADATIKSPEDESSSHNTVRSGMNTSTIEHKDPYWGDLPQGQGIYNTVSGHGSTSDEARRHHIDDHSDQRSFPLVTDRARQHHHEDAAPLSKGNPENVQTEQAAEKMDSHWKESVAGGTVAGAAGAAAYKATRDDEDRQKSRHDEHTAEEKEKKGHGGLFGVFHRGSKEDKEKDKSREYHHSEKEHHHKDKPSKEETMAPVAAAGHALREDKHREEQRQPHQNPADRVQHYKTDPAVAAAAVAYSQPGDAHQTSTAGHSESLARSGNTSGYDTLPSGTASGIRMTGDSVTHPHSRATPREADGHEESHRNAMYSTAGAAAALGAGGYAAHEYRKSPAENETSVSRSANEQPSRSAGWFTSPTTNTTASTSSPTQIQHDIPVAENLSKKSDVATTLAASTPVAPSSDRGPTADSYPSASATGSSEPTMREPSTEIPRITEDANHGKYNVLASGTPSGINMADSESNVVSTGSTETDEKSKKSAMAATGLAAAGAGAGATTLAARHQPDDEKDARTSDRKTSHHEQQTPSRAPELVGGRHKVTHNCVKCGEENDITQYLKDRGNVNL